MTSDPGKERRRAIGVPVVPVFDGYRAYAIAGVVLLHLLVFSGVLDRAGSVLPVQVVQATLGQAIDVLFIISGFVVFLPAAAREGAMGGLGAYAMRRAARLVPAYWLALGLLLVVIAAVPLERGATVPGVGSVLAHLTFLQGPATLLASGGPLGFGIDGPVWTLSLEVSFYLLLPLVAGLFFRRPIIGLVLAALLTGLWHEAIGHIGGIATFLGQNPSPADQLRLGTGALIQFPYWAFSFAMGMAGARAYVHLSARHARAVLASRASRVQLAAALVLAALAVLVGRASADGGVLLGAEAGRRPVLLALGYSGALATLMVATALGHARWQRPFANRFARELGDVSYGIYLVHVVVCLYVLGVVSATTGHGALLRGDGRAKTLVVLAAIVVPVSVLYGYLSARWVEQPIRRRTQRYGRRSGNVVERGMGRPRP